MVWVQRGQCAGFERADVERLCGHAFWSSGSGNGLEPGGMDQEWKGQCTGCDIWCGGESCRNYTRGGIRGTDAGTGDRVYCRSVLLLDGDSLQGHVRLR